ncbi:MAG: holin, partial [Romboutsia sp.]|nr:holin [Romboutsia sp.]
MDMVSFVPESLFILVVAINILGTFLKKLEQIKDNFIPIILLGFSIIFAMLLEGMSPTSFLQG